MKENEIDKQLEQVRQEDTTKGERFYARRFKSVYQTVRKSLVIIAKNRKELSSQVACDKAKEVLRIAYNQLENE